LVLPTVGDLLGLDVIRRGGPQVVAGSSGLGASVRWVHVLELADGQPGLLIALDPIATDTCDHRFEAAGHDPGVKLRHLTEIRHATCTGPTCRRPAARCDFEHNTPYEAGGRTYTTEPTRYPI
jgi:hypothetical protein